MAAAFLFRVLRGFACAQSLPFGCVTRSREAAIANDDQPSADREAARFYPPVPQQGSNLELLAQRRVPARVRCKVRHPENVPLMPPTFRRPADSIKMVTGSIVEPGFQTMVQAVRCAEEREAIFAN